MARTVVKLIDNSLIKKHKREKYIFVNQYNLYINCERSHQRSSSHLQQHSQSIKQLLDAIN